MGQTGANPNLSVGDRPQELQRMVGSLRIERSYLRLQRSAPTTYANFPYGTRGRIQTYDLPLRRRLLYSLSYSGMAGEVRTRTHDGLQSTVLETVALAAMRLPYVWRWVSDSNARAGYKPAQQISSLRPYDPLGNPPYRIESLCWNTRYLG